MMYTETSCCGADRCMFGSIFVVWASRRSRSHHLKSSNAILTEQHNNGGTRLCFSFSTGTSRLRVLMLAVGVFAT
ncbi:hypothetical protein BS47DRAFT_1356683 [Hydnum rufescens UP504]|uniref:Uncharacterized protein n=1 Tax=Hydnum rufescens UP504 TaxID=1448309 RepID=A0A9P6ADA4_9AGAM|nr:hypothetical protein BS47DRAFT_1356683 [Hydnum rufescens UP504]